MQSILHAYAEQGIKLTLAGKRVKNINFRLKPMTEAPFTSLLAVSYPYQMPNPCCYSLYKTAYRGQSTAKPNCSKNANHASTHANAAILMT